jgi:predicted membrane protein
MTKKTRERIIAIFAILMILGMVGSSFSGLLMLF